MTDDERRQIAEDARRDVTMEKRMEAVEGSLRKLWVGLGAAAFMIGSTIWDNLKEVLFK